ncbi:MAG: tyrosine-type recombinase/integrase, partial [Selenomonadaceae bacterium]|nr:tyrosine-type recombinase/integrase [Selenomonadaceae bacterium]
NAPKNITKRHIITPEQFAALLEKYPFGTPLYIPLLLLYHTGMRLGEVVGLSWSDIDFEAKKINLHQQLQYLSKRGYFFTTLKTESSNRYIIVDDFLLGELRRWQSQQFHTEARIKVCAEKIFPQQNLSSLKAAGFFFAAVDVNLVTC